VNQSLTGRSAHGNGLVAAAWRERLRGASSTARNRAGAYAQQLAGGSRSAARASMPEALGTFAVWAVTSLAAGSNFPLRRELFDLVVIDEASQSDLASTLPLLFRARRALVVGDPYQLTHFTSLSARRDEQLARAAGLTEEEHGRFSYKSTSLFAAAERVYHRDPVFLCEHFRSHPDVIGFSNREVYGGRLVVRTPPDRLLPGRAVEWIHRAGPWEPGRNGRSVRKPMEAEAVLDELERQWTELQPLGRSVGVVSPFRPQVELLRDRLGQRLPDLVSKVAIDTAHGFQGDEWDVMILSLSVAPGLGPRTIRFAGDRNLVNVAVTRARARLVVVGDHGACLASGSLLAALAQYALDLGAVR
jgi:superfamily I DNA and/or RNA helicase